MMNLQKINARYSNWVRRMPHAKSELKALIEAYYNYPYCECCDNFVDWIDDESGDCQDCIDAWNQKQREWDYYKNTYGER